MMYQCIRGLGLAYLADALQPVATRQDSRSTTPGVVVDVGIGCPVYTTAHCHCQRPSVSRLPTVLKIASDITASAPCGCMSMS